MAWKHHLALLCLEREEGVCHPFSYVCDVSLLAKEHRVLSGAQSRRLGAHLLMARKRHLAFLCLEQEEDICLPQSYACDVSLLAQEARVFSGARFGRLGAHPGWPGSIT